MVFTTKLCISTLALPFARARKSEALQVEDLLLLLQEVLQAASEADGLTMDGLTMVVKWLINGC